MARDGERTLIDRLRSAPIGDGLTTDELTLMAGIIADMLEQRRERRRAVEAFDATDTVPAAVLSARRHAQAELQQVAGQISHWQAECGFRFDSYA